MTSLAVTRRRILHGGTTTSGDLTTQEVFGDTEFTYKNQQLLNTAAFDDWTNSYSSSNITDLYLGSDTSAAMITPANAGIAGNLLGTARGAMYVRADEIQNTDDSFYSLGFLKNKPGTEFYHTGFQPDLVYNPKEKAQHKNNFNFINSGFNLRPLEISAAIGFNQFKKLNRFKKIRFNNRIKIISKLRNSSKWKNQFTFIDPIKKLDPSWFGLPILINKKYKKNKNKFLDFLNKNGIETRPIISGNFLNQPSVKLYKLNKDKEVFKYSQDIEERGFFIGIHIDPISNKKLDLLENKLLKVSEI